jgi:hypothetical protein
MAEMIRYLFGDKWENFQHWWTEQGPRKWINNNPKIVLTVTTLSAIILILAIIPLLRANKIDPIKSSENQWYYDLNTNELFTAQKGLPVPTEAPSGPLPNGKPAGVRACVLSFKLEPKESETFIGYLETSDPNAKNLTSQTWSQGKLIRRIQDDQWFTPQSSKGKKIIQEAFIADMHGERPIYVKPK